MPNDNAISTLIADWPNRRAFADEIGAPVANVHKWAATGRIPTEWQWKVVRAALKRGLAYVTADWMLEIHGRASCSPEAGPP